MANAFDEFDAPAKTEAPKPEADPFAEFDQPAKPAEKLWGKVAAEAVTNVPKSVGGLVEGIAGAVAHPVETAKGLGKMVVGAGESLTEKAVGVFNPELVKFNEQINPPSERQKAAEAAGNYYKSRYGSEEGFKRALADDPAGVAADMASVLYGGAGVASKAGLVKAGEALTKAGSAIDPLTNVLRAGKGAAGLTKGVSAVGAGLTTGAGIEPFKEAYRAGKIGGATGKQFQEHLRGQAEFTDVLPTLKSDIANLQRTKMAEYKKNMAAVKADKTVLDFNNIDKALADAGNIVTYRGAKGTGPAVVKNEPAANALKQIHNAIEDWKQHGPDYHTAEGFDQLKQIVGGIVDSIPREERTARKVGRDIYNTIKDDVTVQAPIYAKTMKAYREASEHINEIERSLSLGETKSADAAMRKLQSVMRNNVATNYGNRLKLVKELQEKGGHEVTPALAGQALSSKLPRGIQQATTIPTALGAFGAGGGLAAAPLLAASSPRLMGEIAYYAGKSAKGVNITKNQINKLAAKMKTTPEKALNTIYQLRDRMQKEDTQQTPLAEGMQ
jgi:hypothetical protein